MRTVATLKQVQRHKILNETNIYCVFWYVLKLHWIFIHQIYNFFTDWGSSYDTRQNIKGREKYIYYNPRQNVRTKPKGQGLSRERMSGLGLCYTQVSANYISSENEIIVGLSNVRVSTIRYQSKCRHWYRCIFVAHWSVWHSPVHRHGWRRGGRRLRWPSAGRWLHSTPETSWWGEWRSGFHCSGSTRWRHLVTEARVNSNLRKRGWLHDGRARQWQDSSPRTASISWTTKLRELSQLAMGVLGK